MIEFFENPPCTVSPLSGQIMSQIRQNMPHKFHYQGFYIDDKQCLGSGFCGEVYRASCDQLPCATKILHNHPERDTISGKIEQERVLLSNIRHPHIVQFSCMIVMGQQIKINCMS